jgi:hypothetical protein
MAMSVHCPIGRGHPGWERRDIDGEIAQSEVPNSTFDLKLRSSFEERGSRFWDEPLRCGIMG